MPTVSIERIALEIEANRRLAYEPTTRLGTTETVRPREVKLVAEGDSWFSYFPPYDVLANLRNQNWGTVRYDVRDQAHAGDTLNNMVYGRPMVDVYQLIEKHRPDAFIFSGGGNDITGKALFVLLYNHKAVQLHGMPELNKSVLGGLVKEVFWQAYMDLVDMIRWKAATIGKPELPIIVHGYDYAIPDGRAWGGGIGPGPWLSPSLTEKGYDIKIDEILRRQIVRRLIDSFNEMLEQIASTQSNVHYVNLRGTLSDSEWGNELHPTQGGFVKVAQKIEIGIRSALGI
jgi:hypothetical protein